ncbi:hypothetical protein [Sodalinema gerasimenkoae]|nr:hypothetical protein [Sodalinema gerasimenkoae]
MTLFAERSPRYCATQRMQVGQSANAVQMSPEINPRGSFPWG